MKKTIYIISIGIVLLLIGFIGSFIRNGSGELVVIKLKHEKIYLRHKYQGLSSEYNTISKTRYGNSYLVFDDSGSSFFYKVAYDTLYIYGGLWTNEKNSALNLPIIYNELSLDDEFALARNYKIKNMKVFPPSQERIIENNNR